MAATRKDALAGKTFRWTFLDGPTVGKTYEHHFRSNGTVTFREVNSNSPPAPADEKAPGSRYASYEIAPHTYLVSYLSDHGYTLTVSMNLDSKRLFGFASNDKEWHPLEGTVEVVE